MSEEENRDASNLLLLCRFHAWEVDDIPDQYPAEMLRDWKRAQLDEHDVGRILATGKATNGVPVTRKSPDQPRCKSASLMR